MTHKNASSAEEISSNQNLMKKNHAFRIAAVFLGAAILSPALPLFLALQSGAWQMYALIVLNLALGVLAFGARRAIQHGEFEKGMWILIMGTMVVLPFATLLISGLGLILGLVIVITSYVYANLTLQARDIRRILVISIGVGILTAATDLFGTGYRLHVLVLQSFAPVATGLALLIVGFFGLRQTWKRSMRNKLLVAFIGITLVATGALAAYVFTSTTSILQDFLDDELTERAGETASHIGNLLNEQVNGIRTFALNEVLENRAEASSEAHTGNAAAIQAELAARDAQWRAAEAANNDNDPLVREILSNQAALELNEFQEAFPDHIEIFITDRYGGLAGSTHRTSDYYQADEDWWQAAYNSGEGAVYISQPVFDESVRALSVQIAVPIRSDETYEIIGILRTNYLMSGLNRILDESIGQTGKVELYIPGEVISRFRHGELQPIDPAQYTELQLMAGQGMVEMNYENIPSVVIQSPVQTVEGNEAVNNLGWVIVYHQQQKEAFAPVNSQIRGALMVMALVVIAAVLAAFALSLLLIRPILKLTLAAEEVAAGNLNSRAEVATSDEIGVLASTLNSMTSQLQETLQGLEQRVAARTRDLAIVADVSTATATILESKRLLQEVVDLTKARFNLYHSHIYLLDEEGKNLVLAAGAGEPGRVLVAEGHSIPLTHQHSLVARAARERAGVTVNDVTGAPDFLPNPLLPDTRSELAVPMIVGDRVIGVFDIQSDEVGHFTEGDINIQTTLAAQLAVSIQNVRSFEQSRNQAALEALVNAIGQKIQRTGSVEDTLQTAVREIGLALGATRVRAGIGLARKNSSNAAN